MNRRTESFRLVMSSDERQLLTAVAKRLRRSESDALRWLVTEIADQFQIAVTPMASSKKRDQSERPATK
jgi:hypothetical protein